MGFFSSLTGQGNAQQPSINDEHAYIKWFILNSPDAIVLRDLFEIRGSPSRSEMEKLAGQFASLCIKFQREADTADKLFERVLDLAQDWKDFQPIIEARGGFITMPTWPFNIVEATWQLVGQIVVFKHLLIEKYHHKRAEELFAVLKGQVRIKQ